MNLIELITLALFPVLFKLVTTVKYSDLWDAISEALVYSIGAVLIMSILVLSKCTNLYLVEEFGMDCFKAFIFMSISTVVIAIGYNRNLIENWPVANTIVYIALNYFIFSKLWT